MSITHAHYLACVCIVLLQLISPNTCQTCVSALPTCCDASVVPLLWQGTRDETTENSKEHWLHPPTLPPHGRDGHTSLTSSERTSQHQHRHTRLGGEKLLVSRETQEIMFWRVPTTESWAPNHFPLRSPCSWTVWVLLNKIFISSSLDFP